jgi:hypothetical protein
MLMLAAGTLPSSDLATVLGSSPGARLAGWPVVVVVGNPLPWLVMVTLPLFLVSGADASPLPTSTLSHHCVCHAAAWCHPTTATQVASFTALSHAALLSESVLAAAFFEGTCGVFMRVVCSTGRAY